jgi:KRAB domain-containing zinc finger protein
MHNKHAGLFIVCKHNGVCSKIFRSETEKSEHIREVTQINDKLIKCDFCCLNYWKSFTSKHFKIHHKNDNLIRCSYQRCSTRFRSEAEKQNHEAQVHESVKKQKCMFCNLFLTAKSNILQHYQTTHKSLLANVFKCTFKCKRYFLTEADREEHIVSAHKTKCLMRTEAKCLYCNKICIDKHVLSNHIRKNHSAVKILCKFFHCGQYFHTQTEADEHFEQQHQKMEENKKYHCLKCNFKTASQNNFKNHISRMHGEKILPCPKCSRCFSSSLTLKVHMKQVHSPRKICPHCDKSYLHIKRHLKQEKCNRCQEVLMCIHVAQLHKKLCKL